MTDLSEYHWYVAVFRSIFATLDKIIYYILAAMFNIFYMIAGAELKTNSVVTEFFGRIQLIFGIIIVFKLVISFFTAIVDPESLSDKQKGIGSIIKRVVVVLIMFILIVPLNIPEENDGKATDEKNSMMTWNQRMNQSGILFGTMYELQSRILNGNVIQNIILGKMNDDERTSAYTKNGDIISTYLLESFILVNLVPDAENYEDSSNWMCHGYITEDQTDLTEKELSDTINAMYSKDSFSTQYDVDYDSIRTTLLNNINMKCDVTHSFWEDIPGARLIARFTTKLDGERYFFVYHLILSSIIGIVFIIMILSLTIDVAVRVFKLLLLRIISPVAILSYIDPKSEKTFNNWVKAVSTTYLDLFIRIAVISFIMLFIRILPSIDFEIPGSGLTKLFAHVILMFGLLFFAKEAPKFITDTLGIDSKEGSGLFSGIGKLRSGTAAVGGILSGGISNARATNGNAGRKAIAFLTGGVGGGINAGKEFFKNGSDANSIKNATRRYSQQNYERAADDSTFGGRMKAGWQERLGIKTDYDKMNDKIKYFKAAGAAMQRVSDAFDGNGSYKFTLDADFKDIKDQNGNVIMSRLNADGTDRKYTLKEMKDILNHVNASGDERLISEVDAAMKREQGKRLDHLRTLGRTELEKLVNDRTNLQYTENDLIAYDGAARIYNVATIYKDEPSFAGFFDQNGNMYKFDGYKENGVDKLDSLGWGPVFKNSASQANKKAGAIEASDEYAESKANVARAKEKNNN